ncbi:hypothetical protein HK405_006690, partial [Cladochytrium tenue]
MKTGRRRLRGHLRSTHRGTTAADPTAPASRARPRSLGAAADTAVPASHAGGCDNASPTERALPYRLRKREPAPASPLPPPPSPPRPDQPAPQWVAEVRATAGADLVAVLVRAVPALSDVRWRRGERCLRLNVPYSRPPLAFARVYSADSSDAILTLPLQNAYDGGDDDCSGNDSCTDSLGDGKCRDEDGLGGEGRKRRSAAMTDRLEMTEEGRALVASALAGKARMCSWTIWRQHLYCGGV